MLYLICSHGCDIHRVAVCMSSPKELRTIPYACEGAKRPAVSEPIISTRHVKLIRWHTSLTAMLASIVKVKQRVQPNSQTWKLIDDLVAMRATFGGASAGNYEQYDM